MKDTFDDLELKFFYEKKSTLVILELVYNGYFGKGHNGMDKKFMQQADIQMSADEWIPIGTLDKHVRRIICHHGIRLCG